MSDLKHQSLEALLSRHRGQTAYVAQLKAKLNAEQQRLTWINHYIAIKQSEGK